MIKSYKIIKMAVQEVSMKRFIVLFIILCSLFINFSCGGGGSNGSGESDDFLSDLVSMNITDARSIFISSGSSTSSSGLHSAAQSSGSNSAGKLFKIDSIGKIDEISFFDKNHKEINPYGYSNELVPVFIENINEDYVAVVFSSESGSTSSWGAILARKTDGAIYKIKNIPDLACLNLSSGFIKKDSLFKSDSEGNIYYINRTTNDNHYSARAGITKISVPEMSSTIITPATDTFIYGFEVDSAGNIVYYVQADLFMEKVYRLRSSTGIYNNLPINSIIWKELDGNIHFLDGMEVKMINPDTFDITTYGSFSCDPNSLPNYIISSNGYTYLISTSGILEVFNSTASPRVINLGLPMSKIFRVTCTENFYYIAGKDSSSHYFLIKIAPGENSYTSILGNDYQVYAFSVSETDGIIFNALRTNDMKKVICKISIDGTGFELLDFEADDPQIIYLERIR